MTTDQPSPSLPTVQTRKRGGKLKTQGVPAKTDHLSLHPEGAEGQAQGQVHLRHCRGGAEVDA